MKADKLKIAVASGKGGTGKTTVSVNLLYSIQDLVENNLEIIDCDTEEPNVHLFTGGEEILKEESGIRIPVIDKDDCSYCGRCAKVCNYNAIVVIRNKPDIIVVDDLCHGCGACTLFCPPRAIHEEIKPIGTITNYKVNNKINLIEGRLNIGSAVPTPIVRDLKKKISSEKLTIIDAPPGTSCPVVESIEDCDYVILVTEPTPFGLNDLKLAYDVVKELNIPAGLIINRSDLGDTEVRNFAKKENLEILLEIPFDKRIAEIYAHGKIIVNEDENFKLMFQNIFSKIKSQLTARQAV